MTITTRHLLAGEGSFRRMAGIAAIASLPVAAANLVTMFAAVHFNLNAATHPLALIHQGAAGARLWHWAMVADILGYYLLIVPVIVALRRVLRPVSPDWIDLSTLCLLAYCAIGAIGGAILAAAIPPLISGYATAGPHQAVLQTVFSGYSDAVYRGMWNLLEEFLAGLGWIGVGVVLRRSKGRGLGTATIALGLACLLDSAGTAVNADAVATTGLAIYLVLAPVWACWLGVLLLRNRSPFAPGSQPTTSTGDGAARTGQAPAVPQPAGAVSMRPGTTASRRR